MAIADYIPRSEVEPECEQRHCPECGKTYSCKPRYRPRRCPACNGKRVALLRKNPAADINPVPATDPAPAEMDALELEITAMRHAAATLEMLDGPARARVMAWLWARYVDK